MALPDGSMCTSCLFWVFVPVAKTRDGTKLGQCRRHPPRVLTAPHVATRWPLVQENDWCGDHAVPDERMGEGR